MELSTTRRHLSRILAVCIAICSALLVVTLIISGLFSSKKLEHRFLLTNDLVSTCETQLTAKYEMLAAESGIPSRVFTQVISDFDTKESLTGAFDNLNGEEDASLYSKSMMDYFEKLCTEFLDGNKLKYNKNEVRAAAEKATLIYSECVGLHNAEYASERMDTVKRTVRTVSLVSAVGIVLFMVMLMFIYSDKNKAYSYLVSGITGGAGGVALGSLATILLKPWKTFNITPAVLDNGIVKYFDFAFLLIFAVSLGLTVVSFAVQLVLHKYSHKK